jgi:hypothetical protein
MATAMATTMPDRPKCYARRRCRFNTRGVTVDVEDVYAATYQKAQTVLRYVLWQSELDELLSARDEIHMRLQSILDAETDRWGIKVDAGEIKHTENNSTIVFPLPIDLVRPLIDLSERRCHPHSTSTAPETLPSSLAGSSGTTPPAAP